MAAKRSEKAVRSVTEQLLRSAPRQPSAPLILPQKPAKESARVQEKARLTPSSRRENHWISLNACALTEEKSALAASNC